MLPPEEHAKCSPRRRRWFECVRDRQAYRVVLSAQAEVVRRRRPRRSGRSSALRAGGGGSPLVPDLRTKQRCSPRRRRWFASGRGEGALHAVLSAQAEVVRSGSTRGPARGRALRAGGGGSLRSCPNAWRPLCSPRRRRWFEGIAFDMAAKVVLSAQAEVVRWPRSRFRCRPTCSPRRRRWFVDTAALDVRVGVLSAQAEVVRRPRCPSRSPPCALRAGGGGSVIFSDQYAQTACSPRRRRWFESRHADVHLHRVLSAQAEVVRPTRRPTSTRSGALRAGGGGSRLAAAYPTGPWCSPRRRRWFVPPTLYAGIAAVLSAQAEVVRLLFVVHVAGAGALRAGGGGSVRSR